MRLDTVPDLAEETSETGAPQFVEHERTQIFARRYEDPYDNLVREIHQCFADVPTVNARLTQQAQITRRLAKGTGRQGPVPQRREPAATPRDLDASYEAAMRALR